LVHLNYINPQQALMMAGEYGLQQPLIGLQQMQDMGAQMGQQGPPMMAPAPGAQQGQPPQGDVAPPPF
jgi:hypothetical protein